MSGAPRGGTVGKQRKIEITIEAERSVLFRKKRNGVQAWCAHCAVQVRLVRRRA